MPFGWKTGREVKLSLRLPPPEKIWGALRSGVAFLRAGKHFPARREVLIIAALAGASVVVTLIVMAVPFNERQTRAVLQPRQAQKQASAFTENVLTPEDFDLPPLPRSDQPPDYYFFRPRLSKWSKENVEKFWVPPRQIATDTIETINDKNMESLFEKVR